MTHKELIESAASYALGALDREERAVFEAHLADCEECQSEVAAYRDVAGVLAHAVPARAIPRPDALREHILRDARQVRPIASAARPVIVAPLPAKPRGRVVPWLVAAAAMIATVGLAIMYRGERHEAGELRSKLTTAQATLARDDSTLAAFLGPEVHVVSLTSAADRKPSVRVFWNHTRRQFIVTALNLPSAPSGRTYQLWALRKGKAPLSMGTFSPDPSGRTTTRLPVADAINDGGFIDDCAMTVEPVGGSPQPTETPRLIGSWRHVD